MQKDQAGHSQSSSSSGRRSRLTEEQKLARAKRRQEKARERHRRYRSRLVEKQAPELRDLALIMLASWCATAKTLDDDTRAITHEFRLRCIAAGFAEEESKKRLKAFRRTILFGV